MVFVLDSAPLCMKSNKEGSRLVIGCVDGSIRFYNKTTSEEQFDEVWRFETESNIRGVDLDETHGRVYAITKNRSLIVFDLETGERTQCILKCHSTIPSAICILPPTDLKNQQLATTDESGEVKTWNFDIEGDPMVRKWNEQKEDVNDMEQKVRSEVIHSELFGVCSTERSVYVGGEDGYVEVFNLNQYEKLLDKIESGFEMGAQGVVELKAELEPTGQGCNKMRLISKRLHGNVKSEDDEVDSVTISGDKSTFTMITKNRTIVMINRPHNKHLRKLLKKETLENILSYLFKRVYFLDELDAMGNARAYGVEKYGRMDKYFEMELADKEGELEPIFNEFLETLGDKDFTRGENLSLESLIVLTKLFTKLEDIRIACQLLWCTALIAVLDYVVSHNLCYEKLDTDDQLGELADSLSRDLECSFIGISSCHNSYFPVCAFELEYGIKALKEFIPKLRDSPLIERLKKLKNRRKTNDLSGQSNTVSKLSHDTPIQKQLELSTLETLFQLHFKQIYEQKELKKMEYILRYLLNNYRQKDELFKFIESHEEKELYELMKEGVDNLYEKDTNQVRILKPEIMFTLATIFLQVDILRLSSESIYFFASIAMDEFIRTHQLPEKLKSREGRKIVCRAISNEMGKQFDVFEDCHRSFLNDMHTAWKVNVALIEATDFLSTLREFKMNDEFKRQLETMELD